MISSLFLLSLESYLPHFELDNKGVRGAGASGWLRTLKESPALKTHKVFTNSHLQKLTAKGYFSLDAVFGFLTYFYKQEC